MATNTGHAEMPYRVLGSTKERVSAIGLGGWHLGLKKVDEPLSIRIVRDAIHRGINFICSSGVMRHAPQICGRTALKRPSGEFTAR